MKEQITSLYRHYDANGILLYVGISLSAIMRLGQHRTSARWFKTIATVKIEHYPSRSKALEAEIAIIENEKPLHNIRGTRTALTEDEEEIIERSKRDVIERIVRFYPIYTMKDLCDVFSVGPTAVRRMIDSKAIDSVIVENSKGGNRRVVTGWQLIAYIERLEKQK